MSEITLSANAYCKLLLHAHKYPHCAVNGVLLADPSKSKNNKDVVFVDAIPLFHISLNLTPMAEVALTQIDQLASSNGLVIGGYYVANENVNDNSLDRSLHRIADKIAENFNPACLIIIDNSKIGVSSAIPLKVATFTSGKYQLTDTQDVILDPPKSLDACQELILNYYFNRLVDFDNHLDDISLDWRNPALEQVIKEALKAN